MSASARLMAGLSEATARSDRIVSVGSFLVVELFPVDLDPEAVESLFLELTEILPSWRKEWEPSLMMVSVPPRTLSVVLVFLPGTHILGGSIAAIVSILSSQLSLRTQSIFRAELTEFSTVLPVYWFLSTRSTGSRLGAGYRSGRWTLDELATLPPSEIDVSDDLFPDGGLLIDANGNEIEMLFDPDRVEEQVGWLFGCGIR